MIYLFGGGTVNHVRSHLALCAPAYGSTARAVGRFLYEQDRDIPFETILTRMAAEYSTIESNADVARVLDKVLQNPRTTGIFFNVALCDYEGAIGDIPSGKYADRLASRAGVQHMVLTPADKLLGRIKAERPDVVVVGSKTTAGATTAVQIERALAQIEDTGVNLVLANDTVTRQCLLVTKQSQQVIERTEIVAYIAGYLAEAEAAACVS